MDHDVFRDAARDYIYLAERGYSDKAVLKLIGDRYQLRSQERSRLFRGIFPPGLSDRRRAKKFKAKSLAGIGISIDGFNVLYTIISYLLGKDVFTATDSYVRDASEAHGRPYREELRLKAWNLLLGYLVAQEPGWVQVYFDEPIPSSGEMAAIARAGLEASGIPGSALTVASADHWISKAASGVVATADGVLIDRSSLPVADLPSRVLGHHFDASFTDLATLVQE